MTIESVSVSPEQRGDVCVHHWIVEPASGPISRGRCKRCGEERTFSNSTEAATEEVLKAGAAAERTDSRTW